MSATHYPLTQSCPTTSVSPRSSSPPPSASPRPPPPPPLLNPAGARARRTIPPRIESTSIIFFAPPRSGSGSALRAGAAPCGRTRSRGKGAVRPLFCQGLRMEEGGGLGLRELARELGDAALAEAACGG